MKKGTLYTLIVLSCVMLFLLPEFSSLTGNFNALRSNTAYAQEFTPTPPPGLSRLLLPVAGGNIASQTLRPNTLRSRQVNIDFNVLPASSGQVSGASLDFVELNLFSDAVLIGQEVRLDTDQLLPGGYVWIGKVSGDDSSQIILSIGNGLLEGFVSTKDNLYQITFDGAKGQIVNQLVPGSVDPKGDDSPVPPNRQTGNTPNIQTAPNINTPQNFYQIDLMVVYTSAAATAQGGTTAMQNAIQAAVAAANQAYLNSDINLRLRLVHTEQVTYTESGSMGTDLNRLTLTGGANSAMDSVQTTRNAQNADLVTLITNEDPNSEGYCGLGWLFTPPLNTSFESHGYNVVARDCLPGGRTLAHELGHNMGAAHDIQNTGGQPGAYSYAYGYYDPNGRFRDIMAYINFCGYPCPTVNYFSNTTQKINGYPLGTANADTARALNNTAPIVSAFRGSAVSLSPTATPGSGIVSAPSTPVPTATPNTCDYTIVNGDSAGLVSAISSANGNGSGLDVICLAEGGVYTFTSGSYGDASTYGNNALPLITSNITILGNGATLKRSGNNRFRFFYVSFGASLSLDNLSLLNGNTADPNFFRGGGALFNAGMTTISRGYFADNISNDGGAIYTWGVLNIADSKFTGNSAFYGAGVMAANGISIVNIQRSFFIENSAETGAAIYAEAYSGAPSSAQVTVAASCFVSNTGLSVDVSDDYPAQNITASNNWWNSSSGPGLYDGSVQAGDMVNAAEVNYSPYLTVLPDYCFVPEASDGSAPAPNYFTVNTPTLTWNPLIWAHVYEVQVSGSTSFSPLAFSKNDVNASTPFVPVSPLSTDGLYYWRVRGCQSVGVGCGAWSTTQSFVVNTH